MSGICEQIMLGVAWAQTHLLGGGGGGKCQNLPLMVFICVNEMMEGPLSETGALLVCAHPNPTSSVSP